MRVDGRDSALAFIVAQMFVDQFSVSRDLGTSIARGRGHEQVSAVA